MKTLKIGSARHRDADGKTVTTPGYTKHMGDTLARQLRRFGSIELLALGPEAVNAMIKTIIQAQRVLTSSGHNLVADEFSMKDTKLGTDKNSFNGKVVSVKVRYI